MITTAFQLLMVIGIVLAINLLPAFGPPTWALLVFAGSDGTKSHPPP